ncbi:MAG: DUF488 domain-containing protein [Thermodesulfobacteriota bacterium]
MNVKTKRIYEQPDQTDGYRILVDRIWPRGISKKKANIDLWLKDIAPSSELRKWFYHEQEKWPEFKERYFQELRQKKDLVDLIRDKAKEGRVTLVYGAKNEQFNNAVCLKEFV